MNYKITDTLFVLLNLSNPYTIIPCILFTPHTGVNSLIVFIFTVLYLFYRFRSHIRIPHDILFILFIIIFTINMYVGLLQDTFAVGFLGTLLCNVAFYFLLYNIYLEQKSKIDIEDNVRYISKGYALLCYYQLGIVAIMFLLTSVLHLFNPLFNDISFKYDIFISNASRIHSGVTYYFPYHLSLFAVEPIARMPFFQDYGIITGVFHEPHTMTYYIIPFVFYSFFYFKNKKFSWEVVVLSILYVLVAASTTNILCYVAITLFALCLNNKKLSLIILPLAFLGLTFFWLTDNPLVELIKFKMDSGSAEYSSSTLTFAFNPKSVLGSNFLDLSYLEVSNPTQDVGLIIFILNIVFICILSYKAFLLCLSKKYMYKYVGLFAAYFIIHSSKLALRTYSLEFLMFVVFMVSICYKDLQFDRIKNKI